MLRLRPYIITIIILSVLTVGFLCYSFLILLVIKEGKGINDPLWQSAFDFLHVFWVPLLYALPVWVVVLGVHWIIRRALRARKMHER